MAEPHAAQGRPSRAGRARRPGCRRWPNFFVIGAGKSGTTSLHGYLGQHPDIFMAPVKEPRYFALDAQGDYPDLGTDAPPTLIDDLLRGSTADTDDYLALFSGARDETVLGEASPLYLFTARAAANMRRRVPQARMVAVLRQPVELAYSAFMMTRRNGYDDAASFSDALPDPAARSARSDWRWRLYVEQALHGRNLQRFFDHFDRSQIKVFLFDDLKRDARQVCRDIFRFLGLAESVPVDVRERRNVGHETRDLPLQDAIKARLPAPLIRTLRPIARRLRQRAVGLDAATRKAYLPVFERDIDVLESLIGRDLSHWRQ